MATLRLGNPNNSLLSTEGDDLGDPFFLNNQDAYRRDVLGQQPTLEQPKVALAQQPATPEPQTAPAIGGGMFSYVGGTPATKPAKEEAPVIGGSMFSYLQPATPVEEKPKVDPGSDVGRGFTTAVKQTPALLKGAVGYLGAVGEKTLGEGGNFTALKQWGLEGYKKGMEEISARAKDTDELTTAWDKAKKGDLGALVDWAQYGIGYLGGNVAETVGTSILGGLAGAAVSGPAAPVGAVGGAVAGAAGKEAVKGVAKGLIESMVAKETAKLVEKAGVETATDSIVKQATKNVAKNIGAATAMAGSSIMKETGGIYGEAVDQAGTDKLDAGDLARIFGAGVVAGASEFALDKLGLDAAAGKIKIPGGGRAGRALIGGAAGVTLEGGQELFQTAVERFGASKSLTDDDAIKDYINSAALGGLGGGVVGSVSGALHGGEKVAKTPPTAEQTPPAQTPAAEPTNSAGFVPEPAGQVQAQVDAVIQGRKPAAVLGTEEAQNVDAGDLFRTEVTDPKTGEMAVVFSQDAKAGELAQQRATEVGLKQAMGEVLGVVEPTVTTEPTGNEVVVQQRDNQSGQVIAEEAVSPENVNKVTPVPGTTPSVTNVDQAKADRTSEIDAAAQQAATSKLNDLPQPTEAQKSAGNYKKGNVKLFGLDISVENPQGSERSGTDASGKAWKTEMQHHYGYVKGSKGADKDHVDVFIGPNPDSSKVFVVDQIDPETGKFDEHKAMLGFDTIEQAEAGYRANYDPNWKGMGAISEMPTDAFKSWVKDGQKKKPLVYQAPAADVSPASTQQTEQNKPVTAQEKPVTKSVEPKKTVESKLKEKVLQQGRLALGKKQWGQYAPEGVKWTDLSPEAQAKWADAVADGKPNMALADELSPVKVTKEQAAADAKIDTMKVPTQVAVEFWEDQDDGSVPHVAWAKLSKERQRDWKEAVEDGYASADLHDKLVAAELQNARAERTQAKVEANTKREESGDALFRTTDTKGDPLSVDALEKLVAQFKANWANMPEVKIVEREDQLPVKIRGEIVRMKAEGRAPGLYRQGKVWLIASNIRGRNDAIMTIVHEVAGHFGLRSTLGENMAVMMRDIYNGNRTIRKLADEMMAKEDLPLEHAVEEVLADIAEGKIKAPEAKSALAKLYAALRQWLRETFKVAYVSDAELRQIVANARRYVEDGSVAEGPGGAAAADAAVKEALARARAPTFYSALERSIRTDKREKAQPKDWKAIISKLPGIKKEEVEWTGVMDWLDTKDAEGVKQVDRQDVLNFIAGNKLHLNDVLLEGSGRFMSDEDLKELYASSEGIGYEDVPFDMSRADLLDALGMTERMASGTKHGAEKLGRTLPGGARQFELVLVEPSSRTKPYKEGDDIHFGDVSGGKALGWLRGNLRKDAEGNDVLFLEEIQSQRGQDMRDGENEVPAGAPFVSDTNAWTALLLKRAIAYAQEKGIDRIAWTTGEQQVDRYRMSKSIDELTYVKDKKTGKVTISATKDGRTVVDKEVPANKVQSVVGKDLADQIEQNNGLEIDNEYETSGVISGLDLDVGGDGVRDYYNKTVGRVADKLLKDFDGKVGVMNIEGTGQQLGFVITPKLQSQVAEDGLPMFRRRDYEAQYDDLDPVTREIALKKGHYSPPTIRQRLEALRPDMWRRVVQGTFDRFRSIRDIDERAYQMARLSEGSSSGVEGLLHYGQVFDDEGALNIKKGTKGLLEILKPVGGEVDRFLLWVAANRAANLKKEDRERFFSEDEIKALQKLNLKALPDGKSRAAVYAEVLQGMNALNRSVLEVAKAAGHIDEAAFKRFAADIWYVPFYRIMEDDGSLAGARNSTSSALVGQYLSKKLKGSERPLDDLMQNVLLNWSHILSASMKNKAANETLNTATEMGAVTKLDGTEKGAVKTMVGGKEQYWRVDDPLLLTSLEALSSLPSYGYWTTLAREFKTTLTRLISLSPTFKINNLIRDSVQSIGITELSKNPVANVIQGWRAYEDDRAEALVGGGLFAMGNAFDGDQTANVKRLLKEGVKSADILTTGEQAKAWFKKAWDKYDEISDKAENSNRLALYQQLRASGASHLEAAYAARDLQDFSLQGSWGAIRYASMILPYFNARLQGMYKLGRDGIAPSIATLMGNATDNERQKAAKFAMVLSAVITTGLVLYLSQKDDDDWKKREEWDKDAFFWFKLPGTDMAVRVPKPFEMGAVSTVAERLVEQIVDKDVEGKVFGKRLLAVLHDNLAINPIPQIVRPLYDIARNKDGFTDRPIQSMGMERLSPEYRVNAGTSAAGVALGKVNHLFAEFASAATGGAVNANDLKMSPIQYDYLLRGYFGWLGTVIQTVSSEAVQPFKPGERTDRKIDDILVLGNYVKSMPQAQSRWVTSFYENAKEVAMATADYRSFVAAGDAEKAADVMNSKRDMIALNKLYSQTTEKLSTIGKQLKAVQDDAVMDGAQKRIEVDRLNALRTKYAQAVEEVRIKRARGE